MIVRHLSVAALLVAGVAAVAAIGSPAGGTVADDVGPPAGQESDAPPVPKTRDAVPAGDPAIVEAELAAGASVFVPIPAYRMYDSRADPFGKFVAGEIAPIDALTDMNLVPQIPSDATAVAFNVTVSQTEGRGFVQIYGPGVAPFSTSTVNWVAAAIDIANSGSSGLQTIDVPGYLNIALAGSPDAKAHVIIDVTGYYEAIAT